MEIERLINTKGFEIYELLTVIDIIIQNNEIEVPEKEFIGVNVIANLGKVDNIIRYQTDSYDNIISISKAIDGKEISFDAKSYKKLRELALLFLEIDYFDKYADLDFIERKIFNWVTELHIENKANFDLSNYVRKELENDLKNYTFYFKIVALGIEEKFDAGNIKISSLTEDFFKREHEIINAQNPTPWESFLDMNKGFLKTPIAMVSVYAIQSKADTLAKKEVEITLNAIKCFLINESLEHTTQIFDVEFKSSGIDSAMYFYKTDLINTSIKLNWSRLKGGAPVILKNALLNDFKRFGLDVLFNFIVKKKETELYYETEAAINLFGEIISTRNLHERIIKIVMFFDRLIIPRGNSKAKGETILKNNVITKLPIKDIEDIKKSIRKIYETRDKYIHNKIELPVEIHDMFVVLKLGLTLLIELVDLNANNDDIGAIVNHFQINIKN